MPQQLTIGQLAQTTGVAAKTIRYYEQVGVLPAPARSESGYRQYTPRDVHRLLFIRRARTLGLSLYHIKTLTTELNQQSCGNMRPRLLELVQAQSQAVQQQIAELQLLQRQLEQLLHRLFTTPPLDHAEGCRCLDTDMGPSSQADSQRPRTPEGVENRMSPHDRLGSLTVLNTTPCDDGMCACGCGFSLSQLPSP